MRFTKIKGLPRLAVVLAEARRQLRLEQGELGAKIGVQARSISRWETGLWVPLGRNHAAILKAFAEVPPPLLRELTTLLVGVDPGERNPKPSLASVEVKEGPTVADARATMESLVFKVAEDLDIGPRGVRTAIATVLDGIERAGLSLAVARDALVTPTKLGASDRRETRDTRTRNRT
jgi:hypothetical protein